MDHFNSRVGKHPDSVCQEGNKIITNDFSESSLCATQRKSFDNDLNNHGKRLLEICRSADLRILNGRIEGDSLGRPTFHGKSGISGIDYSICDQDLLRNITSFMMKDPNRRGTLGYIRNRKTEQKNHPKPQKKFGQNRNPHTKPSKTDTMVTSGAYRAN